MRKQHLAIMGLFACLIFSIPAARAYPVGAALPLDKLAEQSDLIVKVQAVSSEVVKDATFTDYADQGYAVFATRLKVISVLKGDVKLTEITFHHYDVSPTRDFFSFSPQTYRFKTGQSYILFAKKSDDAAVYRTFSFSHSTQEDQGQLRTATPDPLSRDITVKAAVWHELSALIASKDVEDVTYGIRHLDDFSNALSPVGRGNGDFPRHDALDLINPLLARKDAAVVMAALGAIGGPSPYWSDDMATGWLATYGKGTTLKRGWSTRPLDYSNPSARYARPQLVELANTSGTAGEVRAQAVRSLGKSRENEQDTALLVPLRKWSGDDEPRVRAAAARLWADYPSGEAGKNLRALAGDKSPAVRAAAAYGIGFSQAADLLDELDRLLADPDEKTARAAAISLISFDIKVARPILAAHVKDPKYGVAFVNALAESDPAAYRDQLVEILQAHPGPETTLSGQIPTYTAWDILMNYLMKRDPAEFRGGKLDKYLDALESPPNIGSGPYQTLYQFYHDRGMTARMQAFREHALKEVTGYDLDMFFKRIDGRN